MPSPKKAAVDVVALQTENKAQRAKLLQYSEAAIQALANNEKRAELKAAARKEGKGDKQVALFLISEPHFSSACVYYPAGAIVRHPMNEDPSINWEPIVARTPAGAYLTASGLGDEADTSSEDDVVARAKGPAAAPKPTTGASAPRASDTPVA